MARSTEYATKIILNLTSLRQTERGQRVIYDSGIVSPDGNALTAGLSAVSAILSLIFLKSPAASLSASVISLVSGMFSSEKEQLKSLVYEGYWQLGYLEDFLVDNPQYDQIEVNLPFIEYPDQGVRFISGKGVVTRVHSGTGWIIM